MIPLTDLSNLSADDFAIIRGTAEIAWDTIPSKLKKEVKNFAQSAWSAVVWSKRAESYFSVLYSRVATTRLLGNPKELRLNEIFTDVYIYDAPLSTKRTVLAGLDATTLRTKRRADEEKRLPASAILGQKRIYLTGKPGAGKTTLLRHLVLESISSKPKSTPVYIALKDVVENARDGDDVDLWLHIVKQFEVCKFPNTVDFIKQLFKSGRATLMLDGLDEVTERGSIRSSLISQVLRITTEFQRLQVIITCRVGADNFTFEKFAIAQIADFSPQQQLFFVKRWYAADPSALNSFLEQWAEPQNSGLRDLASTPLLLALLCIGYDETREFPLRRGDLYKEAVEALLRRWSVSRGIERDNPYRKLTSSRKEQLLAFMAYHLFKAGHIIFSSSMACDTINLFIRALPRREIDDGLEAFEVLRNLEAAHGLIVHETSDYLAFSHLTIHEYFTARYLVDSTNENTLRAVLNFDTLTNRQWREVIFLAVGSATSADFILSLMRSEITRVLAAEPNLRRILRGLSGSENPAPSGIWGSWMESILKSQDQDAKGELARFIQFHAFAIAQSTNSASASPAVTRRAHFFSKNVIGSHARYIETFLAEAPETRREKFLRVVYVEEVYANALAIGTVSNRDLFEQQLLSYSD